MLHKSNEEGIAEIAILRTINSYLEKIDVCLEKTSSGMSADSAVDSMRPPIFFKQAPTFKVHLSRFMREGKDKLSQFYKVLYDAEKALKETGASNEYIINSALF